MGAVVVVLANYGRFWADLLAFFVRPYKEGPLHGLAFLFPPYTVYYLATRWDSMKKIVRRIATSCIPIVLVILIYGFLPSVNPDVKNVQGFGAKLEAGKHELDKEIESDLKGLEKGLIRSGEPGNPLRSPNLSPGRPEAFRGSRRLSKSDTRRYNGIEMHDSVMLGAEAYVARGRRGRRSSSNQAEP